MIPHIGVKNLLFGACLSCRDICVRGSPGTLAYIHHEGLCELVFICLTEHDNVHVSLLMMASVGGIKDTGKIKRYINVIFIEFDCSMCLWQERSKGAASQFFNTVVISSTVMNCKSLEEFTNRNQSSTL